MDLLLLITRSSTGSGTDSGSGSGSTEKITEGLKNMVKSPWFYVVIGLIVLLIVGVYILRRFIKARPNCKTIVIRKGEIHKIVDENNPKYFLVPFVDRVGAIVSLDERELSSDKLFINNGPDYLYQINFTLKYRVVNAEEYFKCGENVQEQLLNSINEHLREFADNGNALVLVKDYRTNNEKIIALINEAAKPYSVEVSSFKVNLIQPLGGK